MSNWVWYAFSLEPNSDVDVTVNVDVTVVVNVFPLVRDRFFDTESNVNERPGNNQQASLLPLFVELWRVM